ncbi:MAG: hypothetical protein L6R43_06175 [Planctomycetes bacterium]|nr:hypothetical protein [Planctomycetota bacterium]
MSDTAFRIDEAPAAAAARRGEAGTSLVETLVGIALLSVVMSAVMVFVVTSWRYSQLNREKVYAYEKAVSILTEMQAYLETSGVEAASDLDSFDDSTNVQTSLTITRDPSDPTQYVVPNHPASGNVSHLGAWRWSRQIEVRPFQGIPTRDLRIVTVRIFRSQDGVPPTASDPGVKYAEVTSVLRTLADAYPTTQVYDVYLLSIENVPGWWVFMDAIKPFIETTIDDLQARNPGLRFRTHWITKQGFGRDPWYRPYWNTVNHSRAAIPWAHFYPAKMPPMVVNEISSAFYYVPESLKGWAINETGELNGWNDTRTVPDVYGNPSPNPDFNPFPYTLADCWNHCMRSVDAEAWFRLRRQFGGVVEGAVGAEDDAEPTWHLLLDRMQSSPTLYRNAIFINLHGELLPMPPMRNYSDPAKDPRTDIKVTGAAATDDFYSTDPSPANWKGGHPGVRVVTHPEEQRFLRAATAAASQDVKLRVYAWHDDPEATGAETILHDPIEIQIYGVNLAQQVEQPAVVTGHASTGFLTIPAGWINLGSVWGGFTQDRWTWTNAWFPNSYGWTPIPGNGLLRIDACEGGVDVKNNPRNSPVPDPTNATAANRAAPDGLVDPYAWFQPYVLGLTDYTVSSQFYWANDPSQNNWYHMPTWAVPPMASEWTKVTSPAWGGATPTAQPNYTYAAPAPGTSRPEGYLCGWFVWNGQQTYAVYNGARPVVRCGWIPPEMDPEGVGYTLLRLYNTPLKAPLVGTQGLRAILGTASANYRLYGREYIPCTTEALNNFSQDLTTNNNAVEKNTARWVITIRKEALNQPIRVRNARTGTWVNITDADADHPADANDSDHWPVTVTTRIGSRVQDYNNDGIVDPRDRRDTEDSYLANDWQWGGWWNANGFTLMEVIDRAMYPGAMRIDPEPDPRVGPTSYTYSGGLRVRVPDGLETPSYSWSRSGLANGLATYSYTHKPENMSTGYVWWSDRREDVPASEQAQFMGDPRHCPYRDFKDDATLDFPNAYNWYFDNFRNATDGDLDIRWPGFEVNRIRNVAGDTSEGWMSRYEFDVPRMFKTLRESLANANMLWTTLTGFSYYYLGIGNEIGYDSANGYNNSIPVNGMPFGTSSATTGYEQSITSGGTWGGGVRVLRSVNSARWLREGANLRSYWWGANWIGEQYPDDTFGTWFQFGNLPSGNAATAFYRAQRTAINRNNSNVATQAISLPYGTRFSDRLMNRNTASEGCTSFFNIGTAASTFHHTFQGSTENGGLTAVAGGGQELANNYSFPLPTRTKISRPFDINLNYDGGVPTEFAFSEYSGNRYQAFRVKRFYDHDNGQIGSGLIVNRNPANTAQAAFIVVNGLDRVVESGSAFISRYSVVSLIHSFLVAGFEDAAVGVVANNRITQLPRVRVLAPTILSDIRDPATLDFTWGIEWRRWDGNPYTTQYPVGFAENEADLSYVPMWSSDGGDTWVSMIDNATVLSPGTRPSNPALVVADATPAGDETITWSTPSSLFPRASYLVRVECYRGSNVLHYSFNQDKIYIDR